MIRSRGRPAYSELAGCPSPQAVKAARVLANLSREEASALVSVSSRTWTRWENGEGKMHPDVWTAWLAALVDGPIAPPLPMASHIRELREAAGLTQEAAARMLGVSVASWYGWESGRSTMRPAQFKQWCNDLEAQLENRLKDVRALIATA
ncbi:helix-turn-helix domain-containing protein [Novosphingobium sp. EMRT-2]|uniref:helix-turn-helix domain-containing protein n=1 Tax=Novosphingobium sp. EMRT-2 TaxID=2571749 RepID=UPI0010BDE085|nr:helix-turn-helix transcriptional regulator [Novosphingobium sp. EMRT-2]